MSQPDTKQMISFVVLSSMAFVTSLAVNEFLSTLASRIFPGSDKKGLVGKGLYATTMIGVLVLFATFLSRVYPSVVNKIV